MFYMLNAYVGDDPEALIRVISGTLVFSVSFSTANGIAQQIMAERFNGNLKLMITAPVSKFAYVAGTLMQLRWLAQARWSHTCIHTRLRNRYRAHMDIPARDRTSVLFLSGLALFITSLSPSFTVGNMLANIVGIILAMISPVFFTMEQAPLLLRWLGYVSPLRYAADGLSLSLTGGTDVSVEVAVLAASTICAMALGLWRLPWRER